MSNPFGGFNVFSDIANAVFEIGSSAWQQDKAGDILDHAQNFARSESALNRDFQERMRRTQYQTAVSDLTAAGLNPMLAYSQGGAGTPSGAMASSPGGAVAQRPQIPAQLQTAAQIRVLNAQARNIDADTTVKLSDVIDRDESGEPKLPTTFSARLKSHQGREAWYRAAQLIDQADLTRREEAYVRQQILNAETRNELDKLDIPRAINEARAQSSFYMREIAPYTGELGKLVHSASEAQEAFRGRKSIRTFGGKP